ncbi:uncharacterized protein LOC116349252 isoform X2 [Contarinia nasturtii]|uniref:uncharacterized protein LOC116349252 isoform X2 n=1 Tax=Contarinia nasturtii TaxID=265458 RepID=UPI0012D4AB8F|nr:uncharacterized protein LOC116349252 isoform X2 [Contarinia nasturtii]
MSCISIPTNDVFFKANEIILGSILVYFTYRWRLMVTTILAITHTFITITIIADMAMLLALKTKHFYKYPRKIQTNDSKCIYFKHINQRTNRFEKITSMNFFREKKTYFHSKEKFNLLNSTMFDAISMKSGTKKNFFPQAYLKNIYDSVVIVQMVQIVLSNEKSSVAEPVQQTENVTNNGSLMTSNGMPVTTAQTVATENTDVHTATTSKSNICKIIEDDKSEKTSSQSTNIPIQAVFAPNVNTSPNKNSNVIMVKRSKLKGHSNEIPVSIFRPMSVSTMSKSNIKRSSHAASGRSVIIMNKLDQMKNGSNSNKTEAYEIPAKTNNLLRILNSPPKPINASTLPANLKQTISSTQVFDYQKPIKSQTTGASDAQIPVTKNENIINMDQTKLRNLLNDQNGSKKLNNNFFLCKTEGKVIRLTPLMGSNCFNNIATATVLPSITNGVRVVEDIQQKPICPIIIDKKDPVSSKSPPPLTLAISATNTSVAKTSSFTTHSIFDDIYTKFLNTKEAHIDSIKNNLEMERQNTTTASTQIYNSKFKSNFYTIPTSHEIISSKQHTKTFLQRQNLENSEEINTNSSISTTLSNGKSNTMTNPSQSTSTVFLKHVPKTLYPQSKTDVCDILVTNENNLKILQKPTNDISNTNAATTTNTALNQIHIFPLIANSRNLARTNYVRPQVIITSTNTTDSRIQSIEPDKRNLVDQLREFDMVMEQIKEERNTNEATDNLVLSNLNGILNHHIVDSQIKSAGLQQKINLAIIKKSKAITTQKTVDLLEAKQSTSTSVVVVSNANVATMKSIEPQKDISTKSNVDSSVIQSTLENVASVKINSANLKTVSQSLNQNAAAKHPQKPQEDEHTVQRIYDILAQYAEQISTSPDLNNKPAPRRRIRMVSSKSSVLSSSSSSSSTTTVSSIINSCSNSNSSNESYQSAKMNESRKRFLSLQNDDQCGTDCISTIDSITIQQPAEKKRCLSNIKLEANDFILATVPSLSSYTSPPKSNSNDMLKTSNQIIITTTNSQQQYNTNLIRATVKQDGNNPMLKNINTNLYNDSNKLKPLTIGIANNSGGNDSSEMPQTQSPATILLPNVSMVVSAEQNLQHTKKKFTNSKNTSNDGFYGFTSGFPYKINITSPNKCRQTLKQCVPGQSYRNDNYILPRSLLKYGKNHTAIGEKSKINQTIHSNVTTVMIPSTTNIQRDSTNIKIVSNSDIKRDISKPKHIQFNITKKRESLATIPATSLQSPVGSTLLLRTLSGRNFTDIQNETSDDEIHTIRDSSSENSSNKLPTFTPIKTHQSSIPPFVESIQLPSQIFQSNRGILILDGNKYATLLTTNCTIPTATAPIISDSGLGSIKSSDSTNEPKVTAITTSRTTINVKSKLSKIDMEVPVCNSEHDFLLHNGLNVGSPKCSDDGTDVTFDDFQQNDQIFSMKKLPTLFSENFLKNSDDILHQNDDSDNNVIDDTQEMIFHQHDSHRTHGITRTHGIIERELRLQKSLSIVNDVEYQDLGVDELAPNDLFPDAFITF